MFYEKVPRDFDANLEYRYNLSQKCRRDEGYRRAVWSMCQQDVLYFFSAMVWLYEPRPRFKPNGKPLPKVIPFIPWEHQIPAILEMKDNLGKKDIAVFKSRGEGFSWIAVLLGLHDWLFENMAKIGFVSNTERKADDPGNLGSLLAKVVWELEMLPAWLAGERDIDWKRSVSDHSLVNKRDCHGRRMGPDYIGSQINAFAATPDAGRSDRFKWFLADELAFWSSPQDRKFMEAIRESTECRMAISTPNGSTGQFYDFVHNPSGEIARIRVHWTQNPSKNRGMYKFIDGEPIATDPDNNPLTGDYERMTKDVRDMLSRLRAKGFKIEGTIRSPWYDKQCDRGDATPQSIAQELDLDFGGSMYRVFSSDFMKKAEDMIIPPLVIGEIAYNPETYEPQFIQRDDGPLKLWFHPDSGGATPISTYVATADIGSGLGGSHTSNSVCQIIDRTTNEQVAEWAANTIEPSQFAEICIALSKWFHNAYLGWESNFGGGFTRRVLSIGYGNIYYRTVQWKSTAKKSKEAGWWTDDRTKELMFSDFHRKVTSGEVVIRSEDLLRECGEYIRTGPQSKIEHASSLTTTDESSKGKAHGDRVIAFALGVQLLEDRPLIAGEDKKQNIEAPVNTLAARVEAWERRDRPLDDWDDTTAWDMAHPSSSGFDDF